MGLHRELMGRESPRNILIRAPNWIGDAVMSEPALRGLRSLFPQAELTLLARASVAELFANDPTVTHRLVYDDKGAHAGLTGKWSLAATLRRHQFEMAVLLQNAFEAAFITWLAGIPRRYGYVTDGRALLLTDPVAVPNQRSLGHQVEYYWNLLKPLGLVGQPPGPRLLVSLEEDRVVTTRLSTAGITPRDLIIGINPGSTYGEAKRWLPERFAEVVRRLATQLQSDAGKQVAVVILGAKGEESLGNSIAALLDTRSVVLSGATTIRELMAVVKRCRVLLTNDTGPMHIAAACSVPVVAVFGPTDWRTTAPYGQERSIVRTSVDCAPCLLRECPIDHRCMTRVSIEQVYDAAWQQVQGTGRRDQGARLSQMPLEGVTVFLDRDGTLNPDPGYIRSPDQFELFPGVADALARLKQAGAQLILVTNQSGIARGLLSTCDLEAVHMKLKDLLHAAGASLDAVYVCPHHPDDRCSCRKPNQGMIDQARRDQPIDLTRSYLIGDHVRDIELAKRVGLRGILVTTGSLSPQDAEALKQSETAPHCVADSMVQAAEWLMSDAQSRVTEIGGRQVATS